jgi:hypothetical protein
MKTSHMSNIFCLAPDQSGQYVFSSGNDQRLLMHCVETGKRVQTASTFTPIYGLAADPNSVVTPIVYLASHERRVLRFDSRTNRMHELPIKSNGQHHSVHLHPQQTNILLLSSASQGAALFDLRHPRRCLMRFHGGFGRQRSNYSTFDRFGNRVLVLRPRLPPALFDTFDGRLIAQLDSPGYFNSSTIKSACFAGADDELVATGSDDYGLYLWQVPDADSAHDTASSHPVVPLFVRKRETDAEIYENVHSGYECTYSKPTNLYVPKADRVMRGHRSIVNQVRYNHSYAMLASCGVEKIIKLWSPFEWKSDDREFASPGTLSNVYTHEMDEPDLTRATDSVALQNHMTRFTNALTRSEQRSLQEDSEMISFFRVLVGRDIDGAAGLENFSSSDSSSDEETEEDKFKGKILPFASVGALMTSVASSVIAYVGATKKCGTPVAAAPPDCDANAAATAAVAARLPVTTGNDHNIVLTRDFEDQFGYLSNSDSSGQSDTELPSGWQRDRWLVRRRERRRMQMMVRIKRLKAIRVELMSLLRILRLKVEKLITDAEKRLKTVMLTSSDTLPDHTSLERLKGTDWEENLMKIHPHLLWSHRHVNCWIRLSRQLQQLREMRSLRTSILLPDEPAGDSFEVFLPMVGHMLKLLLANGFDGSSGGTRHVDLNTLRLNHLRDVKRAIVYLWRECWTRAQCRQLMFMEAFHHDSDDFSSSITINHNETSSSSSSDSDDEHEEEEEEEEDDDDSNDSDHVEAEESEEVTREPYNVEDDSE